MAIARINEHHSLWRLQVSPRHRLYFSVSGFRINACHVSTSRMPCYTCLAPGQLCIWHTQLFRTALNVCSFRNGF